MRIGVCPVRKRTMVFVALLSALVALTLCTAAQAASPPIISGLSATSGPASGGTYVIVTGTGFSEAQFVTFGGSQASSWWLDSDTRISVWAPAHAAGQADVQIMTPTGLSPVSRRGVIHLHLFAYDSTWAATGLWSYHGRQLGDD
jgi:hypothetical protein